MLVRVGIPASFQRFSAVAAQIGAPVLVSANALRRRDGRFWRPSPELFRGCDVALDSAGFVAMVRYKGYPWSIEEYVRLAGSYPWAWYASMDYCCEPQVAADREAVLGRVRATAEQLRRVQNEADRQGVTMPVPVLQGWRPGDYLSCAGLIGDLPSLVGIGSVCRRHLRGDDGLLAIMDALDRELPAHVRFHLFGVKGDGIHALRGHPRLASVDSMAWDYAARREKNGACTIAHRSEYLRSWYGEQVAALSQPGWALQLTLGLGVAA